MKVIILNGPMGIGKTTVGTRIAANTTLQIWRVVQLT